MKIYARSGEWVTCENGHKICRIAEDICVGKIPDGTDLVGWRQKQPEMGGPIPVCKKCGSEFYRNNIFPSEDVGEKYKLGIHMHFPDGWR